MSVLPALTSALGLPASPLESRSNTVLVLRGIAAQHVGVITHRYRHGKVRVVVDYGHSPTLWGRSVSLVSGDYVSVTSPTCPALPRRTSQGEISAK